MNKQLFSKQYLALDSASADQRVLDFIYDKSMDLSEAETETFIRSLCLPFQLVYAAFWFEREVENGGLQQYFDNQRLRFVYEAWQACHALGSNAHAELLEVALVTASHNTFLMGDDLRNILAKTTPVASLNDLDDSFYELRPTLESLRQAFVFNNRTRFIY